jgi:hypothetical protein
MNCSYCTDPANGIDEDGEGTCGNADTCTSVVTPLPNVIAESDDEDESDDDDV